METARMSKEDLESRLGDSGTVVIDVRRQQKEAQSKIKNAVFEDPDRVDSWAKNIRKIRTSFSTELDPMNTRVQVRPETHGNEFRKGICAERRMERVGRPKQAHRTPIVVIS